MDKQTKLQKIVLIVIGVVVIAVLGVSAIVRNHSNETKYFTGMSLRDIVESRKTWDTAYTSWYGEQAPDCTVEDIEGKSHKLSDYRGRDGRNKGNYAGCVITIVICNSDSCSMYS